MEHPRLGKTGISACLLLLLAVWLVVTAPAFAQSGRGTINGIVRDITGAVVPGAEVTVTSTETGVSQTVLTTEAGVYRVPYLQPGRYRVTATLPGFKTAVVDNVSLLLAQTLSVDLVLEVGEVTESVTVSSTGPLLETSTSEIGINANTKEVHTWPILVGDGTRQLQDFIFRAMPGTQGGTFAGSINGGQSYSHEILIEGISIGRMDLNGGSNNEFTPTMDAVSEFKLQTGALSSQYGATQTALTNFGMKSGTNEYHGTVFWLHQNKVLNANSWSNNLFGNPRSAYLDNNFGATAGGPIIKDRTHFYFSYEGDRFVNQNTAGFENLPVRPFKQGDYSLLLDPAFTQDARSGTVVGQDALGRDVIFGQIYDPASSRQLPDGTWIRDPFPGNIIPADRMSDVTRAWLKHDIPDPQIFAFRRNQTRFSGCCPYLQIDNFSLKIDHILSEAHKLSGTFVSNDRGRDRSGGASFRPSGLSFPGPAAAGFRRQDTPGYIIRLAEDWTISPQILNHLAIGYNRFINKNQATSFLAGIDWKSELGLVTDQPGKTFPVVRFTGFNTTLSGGYRNMGDAATGHAPNGSTIIADDFSWLINNHSLRFGVEHRRYYLNERATQGNGTYTFHNENTGLPGFASQTGFAYASFFLGVVQSASMGIQRLTLGQRSRYTAMYVQDDWKVRDNLTVNLGLRWDIPTPLFEVAGRMSSLDPTVPNPGADGYPGALVFRDRFSDTYYKQFAPRFGFAWQVKEDLVVRGGYGINYSPPINDGWHASYTAGFDGSNPIIGRRGRFREDPVYSWDNPYPPYTATLPNTDPTLQNGDYIDYYSPETNRFPYVQNWNVGVQFDAGWNTKIEANYVGNKGTRLMETQYLGSLNQVPTQYLSLGDVLLEDISDHPEIAKPYPSFEGTVARALRPFPQYEGVQTHRLNGGYSTYHSLQMTATRRSDYGLSFLTSYTWSKSLGTADTAGPGNYYDYGQDFYNRRADYSVTAYHFPHDLKLTWIYDLPFGPRGKWLTSGIAGKILGGWTFSAIHRYQSGGPLALGVGGFAGDALFNPGFRPDVLLEGDAQKFDVGGSLDSTNGTQYLNPAAFAAPPATANGVPIRLGNAPRHLPRTRSFALLSEDVSLIKRTDLPWREGMNLEIRFDFINFFNRVRLGGPDTDVTSADFGKIFSKTGGARTAQGGLRINW
jgi:hypothetical protein